MGDTLKQFYTEMIQMFNTLLSEEPYNKYYEVFHTDEDAGLTAFRLSNPDLNTAKHGEFSYFLENDDLARVEVYIGAQNEESQEDNEEILTVDLRNSEQFELFKKWLIEYAEKPKTLTYDATATFFRLQAEAKAEEEKMRKEAAKKEEKETTQKEAL